MLGDELWLEAAFAVTRNLDGQFAELAFEGLAAFTVTGIAGSVGDGFVLLATPP